MKQISEITDAHLEAAVARRPALGHDSVGVVDMLSDIRQELEAREAAIVNGIVAQLRRSQAYTAEGINHFLQTVGLAPTGDEEEPRSFSPGVTAAIQRGVDRYSGSVEADRQAVVQAYELLMPVAERLGVFLPGVPRMADDEPDVPLVKSAGPMIHREVRVTGLTGQPVTD